MPRMANRNVVNSSFLTAVASRYYADAAQFAPRMPPSEWHIKFAASKLNPAMRLTVPTGSAIHCIIGKTLGDFVMLTHAPYNQIICTCQWAPGLP